MFLLHQKTSLNGQIDRQREVAWVLSGFAFVAWYSKHVWKRRCHKRYGNWSETIHSLQQLYCQVLHHQFATYLHLKWKRWNWPSSVVQTVAPPSSLFPPLPCLFLPVPLSHPPTLTPSHLSPILPPLSLPVPPPSFSLSLLLFLSHSLPSHSHPPPLLVSPFSLFLSLSFSLSSFSFKT